MRDVYAALLTLDGDPFESFMVAARQLISWSFDRYGLVVPDNVPQSGHEVPADGVSIRWSTMTHPERPAAVWSLSWRHPDSIDDTLEWGIRARLGYEDSEAWLSLRVAVQPVSTVLKPVKIEVGRPQVIPRLLEAPGVVADERRLATEPVEVADGGIADLVSLLTKGDRRLPVVVTTLREDGRPSVDPKVIADRLAGLAHVVDIRAASATYDLTDAVGKERSVFLGAIRLYWPGFTTGSNPREHPLWLPQAIDDWSARGRDFVDTLFARVQREATFRLAVPPLQNEIEIAIDRQRLAELSQLRDRALAVPDVPGEWLEEMEGALKQAEQGEERIQELQQDVQRLTAERDAARQNVIELSQQLGRAAGDLTAGPEPEAPTAEEPRSVLEAVEIAMASAEHVVYLDSALDGARDSDYRQPDRILEALRTLDDVARRYAEGDLPGGFARAFQETGLAYASDISYTDRSKFGSDYERTYDGRRIELGPHLKFGQGSSDTCARIYWHVDEEKRALIVGQVGKHLKTTDS